MEKLEKGGRKWKMMREDEMEGGNDEELNGLDEGKGRRVIERKTKVEKEADEVLTRKGVGEKKRNEKKGRRQMSR